MYKKEIGELKRKLEQMSSNANLENIDLDEQGKRRKTLPEDLATFDNQNNLIRDSIDNICKGVYEDIPEQFLPIIEVIKNQNEKIQELQTFANNCNDLAQFSNTEFSVLQKSVAVLQSEKNNLATELQRTIQDSLLDSITRDALNSALIEVVEEEKNGQREKIISNGYQLLQQTRVELQNLISNIHQPFRVIDLAIQGFPKLEARIQNIDGLVKNLILKMTLMKRSATEAESIIQRIKNDVLVKTNEIQDLKSELEKSQSSLKTRAVSDSQMVEKSAKMEESYFEMIKTLMNVLIGDDEANLGLVYQNLSSELNEAYEKVLAALLIQKCTIVDQTAKLVGEESLQNEIDAQTALLKSKESLIIDQYDQIKNLESQLAVQIEFSQAQAEKRISDAETMATELQSAKGKVTELESKIEKHEELVTEQIRLVKDLEIMLASEREISEAHVVESKSEKEALAKELYGAKTMIAKFECQEDLIQHNEELLDSKMKPILQELENEKLKLLETDTRLESMMKGSFY